MAPESHRHRRVLRARPRPSRSPSSPSPAVAALERRVAELEAQIAAYVGRQNISPDTRLNALLSISAALLTSHDVSAILAVSVRDMQKLLPGCNGVLIFLADQSGTHLTLQASSSGMPGGLVGYPGHGLAGRTFVAPRPMLMVGPELEIVLEEMDPSDHELLSRFIRPWPPSSALLAPLHTEGKRIGSMVLYSGHNAHLFHPRDIPLVQALAGLVAVALAETIQREHNIALQRDLVLTQTLHAEAEARLNAAQAQLLQSAKLAAIGELSASIAHEINNPLYAARNSLHLVEGDLPPESPGRPFLEIAQDELGRIARIITRMRDFYRPTRAELEPTDIGELIEETIDLVQVHLRHGRIKVEAELDRALPPLIAHADQLRQVMLNLMLNACDAMPSGGTLTLRTSRDTTHLNGIKIEIADTGVGIEPEHLGRMFEPFYTTKPQGTGLGLAITAHIVTQHGGRIDVQSTVGVGTTITIQLPFQIAE